MMPSNQYYPQIQNQGLDVMRLINQHKDDQISRELNALKLSGARRDIAGQNALTRITGEEMGRNDPLTGMEGPPSPADVRGRGGVTNRLYGEGYTKEAQAEEDRLLDLELKKANLELKQRTPEGIIVEDKASGRKVLVSGTTGEVIREIVEGETPEQQASRRGKIERAKARGKKIGTGKKEYTEGEARKRLTALSDLRRKMQTGDKLDAALAGIFRGDPEMEAIFAGDRSTTAIKRAMAVIEQEERYLMRFIPQPLLNEGKPTDYLHENRMPTSTRRPLSDFGQ